MRFRASWAADWMPESHTFFFSKSGHSDFSTASDSSMPHALFPANHQKFERSAATASCIWPQYKPQGTRVFR